MLNNDSQPLLAAKLQTSEDDTVLVSGVSDNPAEIGAVGYFPASAEAVAQASQVLRSTIR